MARAARALSGAAVALVATAALPAGIDHQNLPARSGSWTYIAVANGSEARFTDASRQTLLSLRCSRQTRRVTVSARSVAGSTLLVWSSTASRSLPASYNPATGLISAELAAKDQLLDAIAFSRGKFSVTGQGSVPLVVPNWPEATRAVEDCRN